MFRLFQIIIIIIIIYFYNYYYYYYYIIIRGNEKKGMLIDVAISVGKNLVKKEAEKTLKYKDLTTDMQHTWNVKKQVLTLITEATVTISESPKQYLSNIPRKYDIKRIQATATLGTAQVLRKVVT